MICLFVIVFKNLQIIFDVYVKPYFYLKELQNFRGN